MSSLSVDVSRLGTSVTLNGSGSGYITNDNTPTFSGTAEPGSTITLYVDGVVAGTTITDANGDWSITPTDPLTDGDHDITVTATDPAGNTKDFIPFRDLAACERVRSIKREELVRHPNPDFHIRIVDDPAQFYFEFAMDVVGRIREAARQIRVMHVVVANPAAPSSRHSAATAPGIRDNSAAATFSHEVPASRRVANPSDQRAVPARGREGVLGFFPVTTCPPVTTRD